MLREKKVPVISLQLCQLDALGLFSAGGGWDRDNRDRDSVCVF